LTFFMVMSPYSCVSFHGRALIALSSNSFFRAFLFNRTRKVSDRLLLIVPGRRQDRLRSSLDRFLTLHHLFSFPSLFSANHKDVRFSAARSILKLKAARALAFFVSVFFGGTPRRD